MKNNEIESSYTTTIESVGLQFNELVHAVNKVVVGQTDIINAIVMAVISDGHILLEGVPGVAKTTMIKTVAHALGLEFKRIQFTPDLLPADLIGSLIFNPKTHDFETKKGPIFAHIILADEINRAPAKVQAALLEAMQEKQVTIGSQTYHLDRPFLVFATQNPIEQEGTYRLPEAQLDRFMFKLLVHYPTIHEEREILRRTTTNQTLSCNISKQEIITAQTLVDNVYLDDKITDYIVSLVFATRVPEQYKLHELSAYIAHGASPRATLALHKASKARALMQKRSFVIPDDVKAVAPLILRHRIGLSYEADAHRMNSDMIVKKIIATIPAP